MAGVGQIDDRVRSLYLIEPMQLDHVPQAAQIEQVSFTNPWPPEAFEEEVRLRMFSHPTIARPVAYPEPFVAGYCIKWLAADELQIQNVAVHPEHRGRGLGRYLVEDALEFGRRAGCRIAFLEVRESNQIARHLYTSMRFQEVGWRKKYYTHPREDAIVYRKNLTEAHK
jgi:ribosomal-protein-alanine N-acetyltransferase